uniref:Lipoprotein n=1 Tax=Fundidesulfovibrio putealis TaxID=270496 RepID=A0A7C4EJF0_9BACT
MRTLLAAVALSALLCGCQGATRALTPEEFYGFCWPAQVDYNCWDDDLCQQYKDYLMQEHASKQECIKGCLDMQTEKYRQDAMRGCDVAIRNASDWCEMYCRRYFDSGQAEIDRQNAQQPAPAFTGPGYMQ